MKLVRIDKDSRYLKEIINILYKWWGEKYEFSYKEMETLYKTYIADEKIPNLYALIINETLVGMYEINEKDKIDVRDYCPYLANVFVKEEYRGLGYSKYLINDAIKRTKELGYKKLYLHTKHDSLYQRYGFEFLEKVKIKYGEKKIYVLEIK